MSSDPRFAPCPGIYLQSHSAGRPPRSLAAALQSGFLDPWERADGEPWPKWLAAIDDFRAALGAILGVPADTLCPQANLSGGLAKVLGALPARPGRDVALLHEDDFPSMGFALGRAGYRLRFIPRAEDPRDPQAWRQRLGGDVALALLTHVQSNTARLLPVAEICRAARAQEVWSVVDVAQSAGVIPIALADWQADVVLGSCLKWLCGGPGAGFLWMSPALLSQATPRDVGWFSHAEPFAFDIHDYRDHPGVLRFWGGTPSVAPCVVATEGLRLIGSIGVPEVRAHNLRLTQQLIDALPPRVIASPLEHAGRGGTVVVQLGSRQEAAVAQLKAAGVHFDNRPTGMRLSPHVYNTEAEIAEVATILTACL